jgi:hypothetical protein
VIRLSNPLSGLPACVVHTHRIAAATLPFKKKIAHEILFYFKVLAATPPSEKKRGTQQHYPLCV